MSFKVVLLARARQDVQQIYEWLAEQSPEGAARWFGTGITRAGSGKLQPRAGG